MKSFELKALLRSFSVFFISLSSLISMLYYLEYTKELKTLDTQIFSQMRLCSYDLKCPAFAIDFADVQSHELYKLYKTNEGLSSYFSIPNAVDYTLSISLEQEKYLHRVSEIQSTLLQSFFLVLFVIIVFSLLFSVYSLSPLRKALSLSEEFIKDILHDFNTPLATLRLNASMLKCDKSQEKKIARIENAVSTILALQSNLRAYLHSHQRQKEQFSLKSTLIKSTQLLQATYPTITFTIDFQDVQVHTNRDSFNRIVDNILSNAAKYNKKDGSVRITLHKNILSISDTGKGIENPKKVFDRFYKEQERGIGIGLHIVKKLCEELDLDIRLTSEVAKGTNFSLDLAKIMQTEA